MKIRLQQIPTMLRESNLVYCANTLDRLGTRGKENLSEEEIFKTLRSNGLVICFISNDWQHLFLRGAIHKNIKIPESGTKVYFFRNPVDGRFSYIDEDSYLSAKEVLEEIGHAMPTSPFSIDVDFHVGIVVKFTNESGSIILDHGGRENPRIIIEIDHLPISEPLNS